MVLGTGDPFLGANRSIKTGVHLFARARQLTP